MTVESAAVRNGRERLASYGITMEDAKVLGLTFHSGADMRRICQSFKDLTAIGIPYFGLTGEPLTDWPQGDPFVRYRYTQTPVDFSAIIGKPPRYVQMPNTAPVAYYPRCVKDWAEIAVNTNIPLVITEGEFKAAKASLMGFPTIGLGGVYNWRSMKLGLTWLPSLDLVDWRRRPVFLTWDSDWRVNAQVCLAMWVAAQEWERRGSIVYMVNIPTFEEGRKMGLDDFLVHEGSGAVAAFTRLLREAEPLGLSRPLWSMNERFIYAADPGMVYDTRTNQKIPPAAFKEHNQATAMYQERQLKKDGSISYKPVSAASVWLKWPQRREVSKLTYLPGKKPFVEVNGLTQYNTWPGLAVEPSPGDVTPFIALCHHLLTGSTEAQIKWFFQWYAYPLQFLGVKMFTAMLLYGIRHGTGKSLVGYTMKEIYGRNFSEVSAVDLLSNFNDWAEGRQFIMGDDVLGSENRRHADMIKRIITSPEIRINAKFIPAYTIPSSENYMFTSNYPDAFLLEDDDRRMAAYSVNVDPLPDKFYTDYMQWLRHGDGASHLLAYFLELDLEGFNPAARAIKTAAKEQMIALGKSDLGDWVKQLIESPDSVLRQGEMPVSKDLFTSKELLFYYDPLGKTRVTANGIARELAKAGIQQVYQGKPIKMPTTGEQARYYPVRNHITWYNATPSKITEHLVNWAARQGERLKKY